MSLEDLREKLNTAGHERFGEDEWTYVEHTDDGTVVFNVADKLLRFGWEFVGAAIALIGAGEPVRKSTTFMPVSGAVTFLVTGAAGKTAQGLPKFRVQVFEVGFGKNFEGDAQWFVPPGDEGVGSAVKVFGGARVHWHKAASTFNHVEKDLATWMNSEHSIGHLTDVEAGENGLTALLVIDEPNTPTEILDALRDGSLGFSVEAFAEKRIAVRGGKKVVELVNWHHPDDGPASVAIVSHPALGGAVLSIAAAVRAKENRKMEPIKDRADAQRILAAVDSTDEALVAAAKYLRENPAPVVVVKPEPVVAAADTTAADLLAETKRVHAETVRLNDELSKDTVRISATRAIDAAKLPEKRKARVLASLDRFMEVDPKMRGEVAATWVTEEIKAETEIINDTVEIKGAGGVVVAAQDADKLELRLERLFGENDPAWAQKAIAERFHDDADKGMLVKRYVAAGMSRRDKEYSFRKIMREATGHDILDLRGHREMSRRVTAAFTTSGLTDALENVMHKRFIGHFENPLLPWREMTRVNPLADFRKVERISRGNYANLATVAEAGAYGSATSWADQGHGYTPVKRGTTDTVTWESMVNDDVGIMRDVAPSLAYAAVRTLFEFVADRYIPTTTFAFDYDSSPVYQATVHGNRKTTALTATGIVADYRTMYSQTDISSSKVLAGGNQMKVVLVPIELEQTIFDIIKSPTTFPGGSTLDFEYIRERALRSVTIPHWTDADNWVSATEDACEVGFLAGREDPELFLEGGGAQNLGDFLTNDRQKWKVRHVYGGSLLRHEKVVGHVV